MIGSVPPISSPGAGSSLEQIRQALGLIPKLQGSKDEQADKTDEAKKTTPGQKPAKLPGAKEAGKNGDQKTSGLSPEQQVQVQKLQATDRKVHAHEMAHMASGGSLVTSGPTYEYQVGPDGQRYAVGGEVGIDTSPVKNDPEATLRKAEHVREAALAPADPSSQDQQVAAEAASMAMEATMELARQTYQKAAGNGTATGAATNVKA